MILSFNSGLVVESKLNGREFYSKKGLRDVYRCFNKHINSLLDEIEELKKDKKISEYKKSEFVKKIKITLMDWEWSTHRKRTKFRKANRYRPY